MKRFVHRVVPALVLASLLGCSAWAQGRTATVDLRKVFDGYWKTKQADAALKDRATDYEKEHKNMLDDWKKAKDDYQILLGDSLNNALSDTERDKRKKSAEEKLKFIKDTEDTIGQYEREARTRLDEQRKRMRDNILGEIRNQLNAMAKTGGFSLVFDTAAQTVNDTPIILFSSNENDLTDALLKLLNAGAPAAAPKTEEKASDPKGSGK